MAHSLASPRRFLKRKAPSLSPDFVFETKTDAWGKTTLHFDFKAYSDVHLGTKKARAKRLSQMEQNTSSASLYIIGDAIDGEKMLEKKEWGFGRWHRQVLAAVLRQAATGTQVTYIPGNHDEAIRMQTTRYKGQDHLHRNLCGKTILGIDVVETAYHPLKDGYLKLIHGDQFDGGSESYSRLGTLTLGVISTIDTSCQTLWEDVSISASTKRSMKGVIDLLLPPNQKIAEDVDKERWVSAIAYGHTHRSGFVRSAEDKLIMNTGSCTEHVEALVTDKNGTFALLEWHAHFIKLRQENKPVRVFTHKELGLKHLSPPLLTEDRYTAQADRVIRLLYRLWPPKERQKMRHSKAFRKAAEHLQGASTALLPLPNPRHMVSALQDARKQMPDCRAVATRNLHKLAS